MDLLETPLEALVFRYFATTAGSLWAWIAVLTAALGLWRIRTSGPKKAPPPPEQATATPAGPTQTPQLRPPTDPAPSGPALAVRPPACHVEGGSTPKGRFTAYFGGEDSSSIGGGGAEEERGGAEEEGDGLESAGSWPWGWEEVAIRRRGDLGWYRYQDLTALNGSVVRLWDGDRGLTAASQRIPRQRIQGQNGNKKRCS